MKLVIVRGGGLAGMVTRTELHSDALPPDAARALDEQATAVEPAAAPPGPAMPDELRYSVRVEHGEQTTVAHFTDRTLPEPVRALIAWADGRPERREEIGPPS